MQTCSLGCNWCRLLAAFSVSYASQYENTLNSSNSPCGHPSPRSQSFFDVWVTQNFRAPTHKQNEKSCLLGARSFENCFGPWEQVPPVFLLTNTQKKKKNQHTNNSRKHCLHDERIQGCLSLNLVADWEARGDLGQEGQPRMEGPVVSTEQLGLPQPGLGEGGAWDVVGGLGWGGADWPHPWECSGFEGKSPLKSVYTD